MTQLACSPVLWTIFLPVIIGSSTFRYQDSNKDFRDVYYNDGIGLFPSLINLARHAEVTANATCGQDRPEVFCRRPVVRDAQARRPHQCKLSLCDPVKNGPHRMADGSKEAWMSPTLENGIEFQWVTVVLDLKKVYLVRYVTIKAGVAPRPAAWILERSVDGISYSPWQYFAETDDECLQRFGVLARSGKAVFESDDDVTCTTQFSKLLPLENGEIQVSLPGSKSSGDLKSNMTMARYIRLRLQRIHKTDQGVIPRKKLFYSIRNIVIGGQCICNGHASKCPPDERGIPQCQCEHDTCGEFCEKCCPLYNQEPWLKGSAESAGACQKCECFGHANSCRYNPVVATARLSLDTKGQYRGGGECINCSHHTTGVNCERCEKGWYRPLGIRPDDPDPCVSCECHPKGSTGVCTHDDSQTDKPAGWCECREGYTGQKCDQCASGHKNFPHCKPCFCDPRGTLPTDDCSGACQCKENVEGDLCDQCKPGFFALDSKNPFGCQQCFCFGLSAKCQQHHETKYFSEFNSTVFNLENWLVTDLTGETVIEPTADPETGTLYVGSYELPSGVNYYWAAPSNVVKSLDLSMYGYFSGKFLVGWEAMRGDTSGQPTRGPNIILEGNNGLRIAYGDLLFEGRKGEIELMVPLVENFWYVIPKIAESVTDEDDFDFRGQNVSRVEFLSVLSSLKRLLLRARFHTDQAEGSLIMWTWENSTFNETLNEANFFNLERCECPEGYDGLSCEKCAFGFYPDKNFTLKSFNDFQMQPLLKCLKCPCNGHSDCDEESGLCLECKHNTEGNHCERCLDGFYGDATVGSSNDCQPCACPLVDPANNFSPFCEQSENDWVCTNCSEGYSGNHCERCAEGFFGDPSKLEGSCVKCDCMGGPCDNVTGACLECKGNTEGHRCEKCKDGFFGDPLAFDCKPCDCDATGSTHQNCNPLTGKCPCKFGWSGHRCTQCDVGFGNRTAGCPPCQCGVGSASAVCGGETGECVCRGGTKGPSCDECLTGFWGLQNDGCYGCNCHVSGSESSSCDIVSGQCPCRENVTGRACDQCMPNHYGLHQTPPCRPCNCSTHGSIDASCDPQTGQCNCKSGIGGLRCDHCLPGYYGYSEEGCKTCDPCDKEGHVCDRKTGQCVCPKRTQGESCEQCVWGSWGWKKDVGCTDCGCDETGSLSLQCDSTTGDCLCRLGYTGRHCNSCSSDHYNYPSCRPCDCNAAGSLHQQCNANGTCTCKINIDGEKCDKCRPGTFGLEVDNPNGCTACFCFGRSAQCTQAGLSWGRITGGRTRVVVVEYEEGGWGNRLPVDTQEICYVNLAIPGGGEVALNGADRGLNVTNNLRTIPGDTEDVKIGVSFLFDTPVYWQLPKQFLGDKVLSYGGFLKFTVETEGGNTLLPPGVLETYPLIQLQGNNKIVLEYFPILPSLNGRHDVRFHESLWYEKNPKKQASRESLMVALQNVQHILIRASDAVDFKRLILKDISMDTAAVENGLALAGGIELCECPPEYSSTSCQNPNIGFFRWFDKTHHSATILISLVGEAKPCECNGRSTVCDTETGSCKGCSNFTGGPHCERCADGYYGNPNDGCLPCPCPDPHKNFASACHVVSGKEPVCFCREGYTGKHCDRCGYGWYGHPELPGGFCQPCECHPYGSVSDECHEQTGQCNCRPGIDGLDCSICPNRTVLTVKGCSKCEDGCSGPLIKDFDELGKRIEHKSGKLLNKKETPWYKLQNFVDGPLLETEELLKKYQHLDKQAYHIFDNELGVGFKANVADLLEKMKTIEGNSIEWMNQKIRLRVEIEQMVNQLSKVRDDIDTAVASLKNYNEYQRVVSDSAAVMEAQRLLEKIAQRYLEPQREHAKKILAICSRALNKTTPLRGNDDDFKLLVPKINKVLKNINELSGLINKTIVDSNQGKEQLTVLRAQLNFIQSKVMNLTKEYQEIDKIQADADTNLDKAELFILETETNASNLTNLRQELKNISISLERKENMLLGLNPTYKEKYVVTALEHAKELEELANLYQNMFNNTMKKSGRAVEARQAYQEIVNNIENVREAAEDASISSDITLKQVFPTSSEDSIVEKAEISRAVSSRLLSKASNPPSGIKDLRKSLEIQKDNVENIEGTIKQAGEKIDFMLEEIKQLQNLKISDKLDSAMTEIDSLHEKIDQVKGDVKEINEGVENTLRPQLNLLTAEAKTFDLDKARENVRESLEANQRTMELLQKLNIENELRKYRQNFIAKNDSLSQALLHLKNQILDARHAAHRIRLSLTSKGPPGCIRSFKIPNLEPTATTKIVLTISLGPEDKNGLLFYMPSSTTADFMALELVEGKVVFTWDLGGGPAFLKKTLQPQKGKASRWYKIIVERYSYLAHLWVLPTGESEEHVKPVSNSSNPDYSWFDLTSADRVWVGGLPPNLEPPLSLLSTNNGLIGCLHSLTLDDYPIRLWEFYSDHTDSCSACVKGNEEIVDESTYRFNGEGYSVLQHLVKGTYNKYQFSVALKFKTYDDNAILFLAVTSLKDRYVLLMLREGRVVFQIGYGESQLEMSTTKRYNDGNWTILEASRSFDRRRAIEKGLLKVGDEMKEAAPPTPPSPSQIPELTGADYLIGGLPQAYNLGQLHLRLPKSFLGCMTELFIDKELYNPLRGRTNGVTPYCGEKMIKVAGFHGEGYLKLRAISLKRKTVFGLALRTLQADALILLANGKPPENEHRDGDDEEEGEEEEDYISNDIGFEATELPKKEAYYSVGLVDGHVEVRIEAGRGVVTLVSQIAVNDGRFHVVSVNKNGRKLTLRVDDEFQAMSTLPENSTVINVETLYLGGVPKGIEAAKFVSDVTPFTGTIKDVLFNYTIKNFDYPISFEGVGIGRLGPERSELASLSTFMRTTTVHPGCRRSRKYVLDPRAVKFGDSPHSFVQLNLRRNSFGKNFSLEIDFRTFYENGIVFILPGPRENKQKHFMLGSIKNGQINIIIRVKKKLEVTLGNEVNDGNWHNMKLQREERRLALILDNLETKKMKLPKKINVGSTLFVGGAPERSIMVPDHLLSSGFKGCLRNLRVNNQNEDLIGDKHLHQRVGQCFPHVERGSYFSGDAYAIHKDNFRIDLLFELEIEFRTSELNGILMSITQSQGYPAFALEFSNGKLIFSGDIGDRRPFQVVHIFPSEWAICDNRWHYVKITYSSDEEVVMIVDGETSRTSRPRILYFFNEYLQAPMYIGGLPEHVPGGTSLLETRENFKGCIRNVSVAGQVKDWTEFHKLHNVLIGSCPAVSHL